MVGRTVVGLHVITLFRLDSAFLVHDYFEYAMVNYL